MEMQSFVRKVIILMCLFAFVVIEYVFFINHYLTYFQLILCRMSIDTERFENDCKVCENMDISVYLCNIQ